MFFPSLKRPYYILHIHLIFFEYQNSLLTSLLASSLVLIFMSKNFHYMQMDAIDDNISQPYIYNNFLIFLNNRNILFMTNE